MVLVRGRWGGVFLVTLLFSTGCATKGDLKRLQDEGAEQAARQEAQYRELIGALQALQDLFEVQSALQSDMAVDTRGATAMELRDLQTQMSQVSQLIGEILRSIHRPTSTLPELRLEIWPLTEASIKASLQRGSAVHLGRTRTL